MNAKDLVLFFSAQWKDKYGRAYPVNFGRDGAIFKGLLVDYSFVELSQFIKFYLTQFDDSFVRSNGHTIPLFRTSIPKLMAAKLVADKSKPDSDDADFKRLETARENLK